jgi:hypothetical protein
MMPWGINCAPYVLNAVVRFLYDEAAKAAADKNDTKLQKYYEDLKETTYVDDILALGNSVEDVIAKAQAAHKALSEGEMDVCKYRTFPPDMVQQVLPGTEPVWEMYKILGMSFNPKTDTVAPAAETIADFKHLPIITKKQAAGLVAKMFDPLGLAVPKTLMAKMMFQLIEKHHPKAAWSTKLTQEESQQWHDYVQDIEDNLPKFQFPRTVRPAKWDKLRLCAFSDASANAVSAVLYEVAEVAGKMYPVLVCARNKVIPHKKRYSSTGVDLITKDSLKINRLELTGALMAAQMVQQHVEATKTDFDEVLGFTDSHVSCHWIWSPTLHHTEYVRKRVHIVKSIIPPRNWRHVPGTQNPADIASRGCTLKELVASDLWRTGPSWMSQPRDTWPEIPSDDLERLLSNSDCEAMCCMVQTRSQLRLA